MQAAESALSRLGPLAAGALQIPSFMRGPLPGQTFAGGKSQFDPYALVAVLSLAGQLNSLSGSNGTSSFATIGSTTTVSVPTGRIQNFLVLATLIAGTAGGPGLNTTYYRVNVGGQLSNTAQVVQQGAAAATETVSLFLAALNLAAGTYTMKVEGRTDGSAGTVASISDGTVNAFLYGG